jgi:superoxide dismutase, Cu-Zn family
MRPSLRGLLAAVTVAACASGLVTATALASPGGLIPSFGSGHSTGTTTTAAAPTTASHPAGHSTGTGSTTAARPTTAAPRTSQASTAEGSTDDGYRQISAVFGTNTTPARTYDTQAVPVGSKVAVTSSSAEGTTVVTLEVSGMLPNHMYGAHAHTKACGATGADAGPHFQYKQDPQQPSTNPQYANDKNEIWLDLTTDASGAGVASTKVNWSFPANRRPHSVVLHDHHTSTAAGTAGDAGTRLACVTVGF